AHAERAQGVREAIGGGGQLGEAHLPGCAIPPEPAKGHPTAFAVAIDDRVAEIHLAVGTPSESLEARVPVERVEGLRPALLHGFTLALFRRRVTAPLRAGRL